MRLDHPVLIGLALSAFAAVALFALQPGPSDALEGEVAMLEPSLALERLNQTLDGPGLPRRLALIHASLALSAGDFATAARVLAGLQDNEGESAEIALMLADAARLSGDTAGEAAHLAAAQALRPSPDLRQRLALVYRRSRQPDQERALLMSAPAGALAPAEAIRLADLLRHARRFTELEQLYRDRADAAGPDADAAKRSLIRYLLETGRQADASEQAMLWFADAGQDEGVLQTVIAAYVEQGALDGAMSVATAGLDAAAEPSLQLATTFLDGNHRDLALAFQQAWLDRVPVIPDAAWPVLIAVADRTGRLEGLRIALARTPPGALSADVLSSVLMEFLRYEGVQSLYPQASLLRADVVQRRPLLVAAWAAGRGDKQGVADHLAAAASGGLSERDWQLWAGIAASLAGTPAYQGLLALAPDRASAPGEPQGPGAPVPGGSGG